MSLKAKVQPDNELDSIRNTLTDVINIVGRLEAKIDSRFDQLEFFIRQLLPNN